MSDSDAIASISYGSGYRSIAGAGSLLPANAAPGANAANPAPPEHNALTLRPSAEPLSAANIQAETGRIITATG